MSITDKKGSEVVSETLIELMDDYPVTVLSADTLGGMGGALIQEKRPDRFIECGIAEANMVGVAAGLNSMGFIPVTHTHAPFATRRCLDQLVISVAYSGLNIKVLGCSSGIYSRANGGTHLSIEDVSIIRSIPNFKIVSPCDAVSLRSLLKQAVLDPNPCYIRFNRDKFIPVYDEDTEFELGKASTVIEGSDATIIASDVMVPWSIEAAEILRKEGISVSVIDMHTIKPLDKQAVLDAVEKGPVLAAENGTVINGLGSAVAEVIAESGKGCRFARIGIQDRFGVVGTLESIGEELSMRPSDIAEAMRKLLK